MKFNGSKIFPLAVILAACLACFAAAGWILVQVKELPDVRPLSRPGWSSRIEVRGWDGNTAPFTIGPNNPAWVFLEEIPVRLQKAVLAGEDFSFYSHSGVDWFELKESFLKNLRERRFARGGSTVTQQLAKNLFLTREKSIKRKIRELILAGRLEKNLTKDRILELYLNVVELGDMVYGVGHGARHHFGKEPRELSLRESAFLAAMLPGPRVYDPGRSLDLVMNRSDHILGVMHKGGWITDDEYLSALSEMVSEASSREPPGRGSEADLSSGDRLVPAAAVPAGDPPQRELPVTTGSGGDGEILEIPIGD